MAGSARSSAERVGRPQGGSPVKRQAILDAAAEVFVRNGYAGASLESVAADAGVSKQTIYNHFGDKRALLLAVVAAVLGDSAERFRAALDLLPVDSDDLERDLVALGRRWVEIVLAEPAAGLRRVLVTELGQDAELRSAWVRAGPSQVTRDLAGHLARLALRGALDLQDPDRAAEQLRLLMTAEPWNLSLSAARTLDPQHLTRIITSNVQLFLRAYAASPRPD